MTTVIIYGIGGYCEVCSSEHEHPLNNIVEQYELPDTEPTQEELDRASALEKLSKLGLTQEEILAILGSV